MELVLLAFAIGAWWAWAHVRRELFASGRSSSGGSSSPAMTRAPVTPGLLICRQGPWGYWLSGGRLMRAPIRAGVGDWSRAMEVDPLEIDLPPAELLEIIDALEQAQLRVGIVGQAQTEHERGR